ncbi:DNA-directed RNA polymerase subunit beta [Nocardia cyriacigeorgica]|uniref:DNA-directed RNA polymerase subunit beta n=1 Tax=Nocardia cyriacigeorgica TaxID=135487 RepID=A0A5R8P5F8_9NOCA|nr:DNA-directed RNA polymerase subunit beta [Nocardia cyriacigeorgica]
MDESVSSGPGETPVSWCDYYQRVCRLPAAVEPRSGRIVMRACAIGAVTMPAHCGGLVLARSSIVGPVVAHPRSRRWSFLVQRDVPDDTKLFMELFRLDVSVSPLGAEIVLPSPGESGPGFRVWVKPPHDSVPPSGMAVVDVVRSVDR